MAIDLDVFLKFMVDKGGSDLFVTAGFPVSSKINGKMTPLQKGIQTDAGALDLVHQAMNDDQKKNFGKPENATSPSLGTT